MDVTAPAESMRLTEARASEPTSRSASETAGDAAVVASDFETFLKLLTAQMRNQDPLQPMDSTEFVAQLASFSAVEQQVKTNDTLSAIQEALGGGAGGGLAEWIGREVETEAAARFDGEPLELMAAPVAGSASAALVARDPETGAEAARAAVDPKAERLVWTGGDGATVQPGLYRFEVESVDANGDVTVSPVRSSARVVELRLDGAEPALVLDSGERISPDAVAAVRGAADAG